tara:strand:- start:963 stop:1340 length:378 start_codon:yes stop_codon:yes gene_type:complete
MFKFFFIYFYILLSLQSFSFAENKKLENEIYKNLRCLVCQGQSVADSNSDFAQTLKLVVKDKIKEGKSKKEIYDFLTKKYGEWIVYKPKFNRYNFLLWFLPYLTIVFGGIVIFILLKKRKNQRTN